MIGIPRNSKELLGIPIKGVLKTTAQGGSGSPTASRYSYMDALSALRIPRNSLELLGIPRIQDHIFIGIPTM